VAPMMGRAGMVAWVSGIMAYGAIYARANYPHSKELV